MSVVLIVEDNDSIRIVAASMLRRAGFNSLSASTVSEAIALIHSPVHFDICFTDIALGPDIEGGLRVGEEFSRTRTGVPIIYTSGGSIPERLPATAPFLPKPYSRAQLLDAVSMLVRDTLVA